MILAVFVLLLNIAVLPIVNGQGNDDYSKILNADLSDFSGTWVNGEGYVIQLKDDGTEGLTTVKQSDGKTYGQVAEDFEKHENGYYTWGVRFDFTDEEPGSYGIWLFPIGVNVVVNDQIVQTDISQVRLYAGQDFYSPEEMSSKIYYLTRSGSDKSYDYSTYIGEYFTPLDAQRPWFGDELKIFEITDEFICFDYQHHKSGHAVVYTAENAYFTGASAAIANGTAAYGDTPWDTMPIRYVFEFTNNNIHLDIFSVGDDSTLLNQVDFKTDGVIEPVTNISVVLNGNTLEFDQPPVILNDRVLVPLRKIFEELGATVDYQSSIDNTPGHNNAELKFISAKTDSTELKLNLTWQGDWQYITYENGAPKESGYLTEEAGYVPPVILNDRTLVPVRFVSETLGASVDWNGDTKTVIINTNLSAERNDS